MAATAERPVRLWLALICVALLVAGCSSGNAREAERGQVRQASEEARVPELQATYSAEFFDPGTPTPDQTSVTLPTLDRLVLTRNLTANGPGEELASIPADAGTVYAGARLHGVARGVVVGAIWRNEQGTVYSTETTLERDAAETWVGLSLPRDGGLPPGSYAVVIYVIAGDEEPVGLNSLVFEITASGTRPRAVGTGGGSRIESSDDDDDFEPESETGSGDAPPIVPVDDD
jgi:hypothetical protein